jgi:hypothetical protein
LGKESKWTQGEGSRGGSCERRVGLETGCAQRVPGVGAGAGAWAARSYRIGGHYQKEQACGID